MTRADRHPNTLVDNNLAADLRGVGDHAGARELDEDTPARCPRVLGPDHVTTLLVKNNLIG